MTTPNERLLSRLPIELRVEISDNATHKSWSSSEIYSAYNRLAPHAKADAKERQRQGGRLKASAKLAEAEKGNAVELIAEILNISRGTLKKIIEVHEAARSDKQFAGFVKQMDREGKIDPVFNAFQKAQRDEEIRRARLEDASRRGATRLFVRRGDIWVLGCHRLMCGDSTNAGEVQRLLAGAKPHLMVTDPPFGHNFEAGWRAEVLGRRKVPRSVPNDDRDDWRESFALFPGDVAYAYHGNKSDAVIDGLEAERFERYGHIVAVKHQFVLGRAHYHSQYDACWYVGRTGRDSHWTGGRDQSDVWEITWVQDGRDDRTDHGTQKPVECMLRPIQNSSQPGDAVYDPFVGSGTCIIAADILKRRCYAMEIDPTYCGIAITRWQNYTKGKAILEATGQTFDEVMIERSSDERTTDRTRRKAA